MLQNISMLQIWSIFMHNSNKFNSCKICGYYESGWFPWGVDGRTPSFDICPQCNVQFGYEDCNDEAIKSYRKVYEEMIKYDQNKKNFHT